MCRPLEIRRREVTDYRSSDLEASNRRGSFSRDVVAAVAPPKRQIRRTKEDNQHGGRANSNGPRRGLSCRNRGGERARDSHEGQTVQIADSDLVTNNTNAATCARLRTRPSAARINTDFSSAAQVLRKPAEWRTDDAHFEEGIPDAPAYFAVGASLSAPALANTSPEVHWTMASAFQRPSMSSTAAPGLVRPPCRI
jgi:hypothetical protein